MLDLKIAKPCGQTWTAMKGNEQVRHCQACRQNVYNIAQMTEREVEELIQRTEGRFCARIYRRTDNRVMTRDCPKGVAAVRRRRTLAVTAAFAAVASGVLLMPIYGQVKSAYPRTRLVAPPSEEMIGDAIAEPPAHEEVTMGKAAVPDVRMGQVVESFKSDDGTNGYPVELRPKP